MHGKEGGCGGLMGRWGCKVCLQVSNLTVELIIYKVWVVNSLLEILDMKYVVIQCTVPVFIA